MTSQATSGQQSELTLESSASTSHGNALRGTHGMGLSVPRDKMPLAPAVQGQQPGLPIANASLSTSTVWSACRHAIKCPHGLSHVARPWVCRVGRMTPGDPPGKGSEERQWPGCRCGPAPAQADLGSVLSQERPHGQRRAFRKWAAPMCLPHCTGPHGT